MGKQFLERKREKSCQRVAEVPVLAIAVVNMGGDHMQAFPTNRRRLKQPLPSGYTYGHVIGKEAEGTRHHCWQDERITSHGMLS